MNASLSLGIPLAVIFAGLGIAKLLALPPMRQLATDAGFSVGAYRRIGALELAGAIGVAAGVAVPPLGRLAAVGLLALLAGALVTHVRNSDRPRRYAPALVCAVLAAGYLVALSGTTA